MDLHDLGLSAPTDPRLAHRVRMPSGEILALKADAQALRDVAKYIRANYSEAHADTLRGVYQHLEKLANEANT